MREVGSVIGAPLKLIGGAVGGVAKGLGLMKTPGKPPAPLATPTRDDAIVNREVIDEVLRRRGGAADIVSGAGGAGAPVTTGKATLGS